MQPAPPGVPSQPARTLVGSSSSLVEKTMVSFCSGVPAVPALVVWTSVAVGAVSSTVTEPLNCVAALPAASFALTENAFEPAESGVVAVSWALLYP